MASRKTRKLSDFDEDVPESSTEARTRLRFHEIEPLGFGIQLPPPQPLVNTDQDSHRETELTMYFYVHPSPPSVEQPQPPPQLPLPPVNRDQDMHRETELTMYFYVQESPPEQPQPPPQFPLPQPNNPTELPLIHPIHVPQPQQQPVTTEAPAPRRNRKKPTHAPRQGKSTTIQPPFPWATDHRAQVHSLKYLTENGIKTIYGEVECKRCQKLNQIEYNLEEKFKEVSEYVEKHRFDFFDRAPPEWLSPIMPKCKFCHQENSMKPVMKKKKSINWLFLFLGQMLGCCTLDQLKYFCKHTGNHRTGAKDRVLFLTYLELCKQLNPGGPFDHHEQLNKGRSTKKQSLR